MDTLNFVLDLKYWDNSLRSYAWALGLFLVFWMLLYLFQRVILRGLTSHARRSPSPVDDFVTLQLSKFGFFFYLTVSLYFACRELKLSHTVDLFLLYAMLTIVTFRLARIVQATIGFTFERAMHVAGEDTRLQMSSLRTFNWLINGLIWLIAGLFVLSNFGINITSFVAGLGIGGIAIALAAQSILGDLFASLTILLDKPFRVGDVITIGDITGTVEQIGVKTCRLRSVTGEQVIIGNSDLTSNRIRNMKRMQERRVLARFGLRYDTPADQLQSVPDLLKEIVFKQPQIRLDHVHFVAFGDFALIYELVYFVLSADYMLYMDLQQKINFEILEAFDSRKIRFAFPTQTVQWEGAGSLPPGPEDTKKH